jgi:hypothetical protein
MRLLSGCLFWALAALAGCAAPPHDVVMEGNADGVIISYTGDIALTEPLARQYCARYERVPVLHQSTDSNVVYFCVKPGVAPHVAS